MVPEAEAESNVPGTGLEAGVEEEEDPATGL